MAKIIKQDGSEVEAAPQNGAYFSLDELQNVVDGDIQELSIKDGWMIVNENGGFMPLLTTNEKATEIVRAEGFPNATIVGNVIICNRSEYR